MRRSKKRWILKALFVLLCVPITLLSLMALALGFGMVDGVQLPGRGISKGYVVGVALMMPFIAHVFLVITLLVDSASTIRRHVVWVMPLWILPPMVIYYGIAGLLGSLQLLAMTTAYLWSWYMLACPIENLSSSR